MYTVYTMEIEKTHKLVFPTDTGSDSRDSHQLNERMYVASSSYLVHPVIVIPSKFGHKILNSPASHFPGGKIGDEEDDEKKREKKSLGSVWCVV